MAKSHNVVASAEELEKFEHFLFEMDDVLEQFVQQAQAQGIDLDFTVESLRKLEYLIDAKENEVDSTLANRAARYLGEVFWKRIGGKWELCLKHPRYIYFKLPVITGYSKHPIEFCPIEVIANYKRRHEPGMLRSAVEAHMEFISKPQTRGGCVSRGRCRVSAWWSPQGQFDGRDARHRHQGEENGTGPHVGKFESHLIGPVPFSSQSMGELYTVNSANRSRKI